jgi:hypothetical protein
MEMSQWNPPVLLLQTNKNIKNFKFIPKEDLVALNSPVFYIIFMSSEIMLNVDIPWNKKCYVPI